MGLVSKALILLLWLIGTLVGGPSVHWTDANREAGIQQATVEAGPLHFVVEERRITLQLDVPPGRRVLALAAPVPEFVMGMEADAPSAHSPAALRRADRRPRP